MAWLVMADIEFAAPASCFVGVLWLGTCKSRIGCCVVCRCVLLHGAMSAEQKLAAIDKHRSGTHPVMVSGPSTLSRYMAQHSRTNTQNHLYSECMYTRRLSCNARQSGHLAMRCHACGCTPPPPTP
jgi:hypothetical protein